MSDLFTRHFLLYIVSRLPYIRQVYVKPGFGEFIHVGKSQNISMEMSRASYFFFPGPPIRSAPYLNPEQCWTQWNAGSRISFSSSRSFPNTPTTASYPTTSASSTSTSSILFWPSPQTDTIKPLLQLHIPSSNLRNSKTWLRTKREYRCSIGVLTSISNC